MRYSKLMDEIIITEGNEDKQTDYAVSSDGRLKIRTENKSKLNDFRIIYFLKKVFVEVFLPQGYPSSVSSDYLDYQIWDTMQAFCSTISGTLTTHAIFRGVGVGDSSATALAATITWIMKDGTGMIGRMLFAWWKGYLLDTDCKKWRLVADIVNDVAMCMELLLGTAFFKDYSPLILCSSTAMKAVVGVAGGATRAAITQHQAIRNNMGDVSAKDGSQETCVNLVASCFGVYLLTQIESSINIVWMLFFSVTALHIVANYKAVKSLKMRTLNTARLVLLMRNFLRFNTIGSLEKINGEESVILGSGLTDYDLCCRKVYLGFSLRKIVQKQKITAERLETMRKMYCMRQYFILHDCEAIYVILHENITDEDVILAWFHAVIFGISLSYSINGRKGSRTDYSRGFYNFLETGCEAAAIETRVNDWVHYQWKPFMTGLLANGWIVNQHQLTVGEWRVKWQL